MDLGEAADRLGQFARFERVLAAICLFTPLVLVGFEGWPPRKSISDYYDMAANQWFYFLLTAAVMLFVVNAFVRIQHFYNLALGLGLALIVLFDHDNHTLIHWVGVVVFFAGNAVVIAFFSRGPGTRLKLIFVAVMGLSLLALLLPWWTLFWTEWLSMAAIAAHFLLDSLPGVDYRAAPRGTPPSMAA